MKKALKQSTLVLLLNAVSIFLLLCIAASFISASLVNTRIGVSQTSRFDLTLNANRFMNGSKYLTNEVRAYAATADQVHYDNYWNEINTLKNRDIGIQNMKDIGITAEEQQMIEEMLRLSNQLVPLEEQAMTSVQQGSMARAIPAVYGVQYEQELGKIGLLQTQFLNAIDARTAQEVASLNIVKRNIDYVIYLFLVAIVIFQLLNYFVIRKSVVKPISRIQAQMGQMAKGNLSAMLELEPNTSEIGQLVFSIQTMQTSLRAMIEDLRQALLEIANRNFDIQLTANFQGDFIVLHDSLESIVSALSDTLHDINQSAEQVSSGSNQVSSGAMALSQGATEQASSVEELAIAINEISQQIQTSSQHAQHASEKANAVGNEASESNNRMQTMLTAMDAISNSSSEIGKIIKTIEDIAFQTNILALNAAVEAARAGAAGKGFAVVADEVRNLASKSAEASKSTAALIEDSLEAVKNGTKIADDTAQSLVAVVAGVHDVNETIDLISRASREQAQAISEVTVSVDQISSVVQTTSATAEESAATSEELSGQAALLKQLVANFKLQQSADSHMLTEISSYPR